MPGLIWSCYLHGRKQGKRNWRTESNGCFCHQHYYFVIQRLCKVGDYFILNSSPVIVLGDVSLVAGLCVSYQYSMVGICSSMFPVSDNRYIDCKLSVYKSSPGK